MGRFIIRRFMMLVPVLIGVSLVAFLIIQLAPGDPARLMAGLDATEADVQMLREKFGLDQPLTVQYGMFVKGFFTGELVSLRFESPAMGMILPEERDEGAGKGCNLPVARGDGLSVPSFHPIPALKISNHASLLMKRLLHLTFHCHGRPCAFD